MSSRFLISLLLATLLAGCQLFSGTRVEEVVSQRPTTNTMAKVLLIGVNTSPETQAAMEKAFARRLGSEKHRVVLASEWLPGEKQPLREEMLARLKAEGITGALEVRLLSYELSGGSEKAPGFSLHAPERVPGARVGWEQDPALAGSQPEADGAAIERKALLETRLFDVATGQVVWQVRSRTVLKSDTGKELEGFVLAITMELRKSGWL